MATLRVGGLLPPGRHTHAAPQPRPRQASLGITALCSVAAERFLLDLFTGVRAADCGRDLDPCRP